MTQGTNLSREYKIYNSLVKENDLKFVKLYQRCWNDSSTRKGERKKRKENIPDFYSSNFRIIMILNYESNVNESDDDEMLLCFVL